MVFYIAWIEPELGFLGPFGVSYPAFSHEKPALDIKIGKSADDFKSGLFFGNASIADMAKTKDLLMTKNGCSPLAFTLIV